MPKTQVTCPQCRTPVMAEVEQLFDLNTDPTAKQRLLSGAANFLACPTCGYQGALSTPIVYHDPEKELLLTYFPPELGKNRDEQERIIGPLINRVVNNLPQEKRKAYLLQPQTMLTYQGLIERILEADGITKEMLQAQQRAMSLIQRLAGTDAATRAEIIRNEDKQIGEETFELLGQLIELSLASGDQQGARLLSEVQRDLVEHSTFGRRLKGQAEELEAAVQSLQEAAGKQGLTREKLLDLVIQAPNETRLSALVSLARQGMDYVFFQMLSERIEQADGEERERLTQLRDHLLQMVDQIDQAVQARVDAVRQRVNELIASENLEEAVPRFLPEVDDLFLQVLVEELQKARQEGDLARSAKINQVIEALQQATAPPPEIQLIEKLLAAPDEAAREQVLEEHAHMVSDDLVNALAAIFQQAQQAGQKELIERLEAVFNQASRFLIRQKLK